MIDGGSKNKNHVDEAAMEYLLSRYKINSIIDLGCSTGATVRLAAKKGLAAIGVDGDRAMRKYWTGGLCSLHDFCKPWELRHRIWDLVWCVEFFEHLAVGELKNAMDVMSGCHYAVVTSSTVICRYHQNIQEPLYWQGVMAAVGMELDKEATSEIREVSSMSKNFMRTQGQVFRRVT